MAEIIKLDGYEHDPMDCALNMENEMRYYTALGQVSNILSNFRFSYADFCRMMIDLDHYYHNWAEIIGVEDIEEPKFAHNAVLPSMFDSWDAHEFFDDDDDEDE